MKIDFGRLKMKASISDTEGYAQDMREAFANVIYKGCPGIAALELARKIFKSEGDTEYTDQEVSIIIQASRMCTAQFIEAIEELTNSENK